MLDITVHFISIANIPKYKEFNQCLKITYHIVAPPKKQIGATLNSNILVLPYKIFGLPNTARP